MRVHMICIRSLEEFGRYFDLSLSYRCQCQKKKYHSDQERKRLSGHGCTAGVC